MKNKHIFNILRGSSWFNLVNNFRVAYLINDDPLGIDGSSGFRVVIIKGI